MQNTQKSSRRREILLSLSIYFVLPRISLRKYISYWEQWLSLMGKCMMAITGTMHNSLYFKCWIMLICVNFKKNEWHTLPFPQIINAYIPTIPLLGIYPTVIPIYIWNDTCTGYVNCSIACNSKRLATNLNPTKD